MTDAAFRNTVKCRWEYLRSGPFRLDTIFAFIDEQAALASPAVERNFQRWPILNQYVWPNVVVTGDYQEEINYLKDFIAARIAWMDANIFGVCITNTSELEATSAFRIFPNPAINSFTIQSAAPIRETTNIRMLDILGRAIFIDESLWLPGTSSVTISTHNLKLPAGCYVVQIVVDGKVRDVQRLVLE